MATYNGQRYLPDQLNSLARQTLLPHELIVTDDQSNDGRIEILEQFAARAPFPVRVTRNEARLGSTRNFERAISLCSGTHIALCDQDDVWRDDKIERFSEVFETRPELAMAFSNAERVDEQLQPLPVDLWQSLRLPLDLVEIMRSGRGGQFLLQHPTVTGATMAFDAQLRAQLLPLPNDNPYWIHDRWIATLIALTQPVEALPARLILYRQHANQQIGAAIQEQRPFRQRLMDNNRPDMEIHLDAFERLRERIAERSNRNEAAVQTLDEIIDHFRARLRLPSMSIWRRLASMSRELASGRYKRFSSGLSSGFKDLF